jgi:hypothetical protein
MSDIGDQDTRSIHDATPDDEIEGSDSDIEDDRKHRNMEKYRPSRCIHMRKYPPSTPDIEHIADRQGKKCNHSKKYRGYPTPEREAPKRDKCKYHNTDRGEKSDYDRYEEHHRYTNDIETRRTKNLFTGSCEVGEGIGIWRHDS